MLTILGNGSPERIRAANTEIRAFSQNCKEQFRILQDAAKEAEKEAAKSKARNSRKRRRHYDFDDDDFEDYWN